MASVYDEITLDQIAGAVKKARETKLWVVLVLEDGRQMNVGIKKGGDICLVIPKS